MNGPPRELLPTRDDRYDDYALRKMREEIGRRKDEVDALSARATRYWSAFDDLCQSIDKGDSSIGLPPYNGGLFEPERTPMLTRIRLADAAMADLIEALYFEMTPDGRRYINYRDLGVQQLGSIYERLLEQKIVRKGDECAVRSYVFARKDSGSYYTPDDLVCLIIEETLEPLVRSRMDAFSDEATKLSSSDLPEDRRMERQEVLDPAKKLLELKVCDPAMGSGHSLVNFVDRMADRIIAAMAEAEAKIEGYISPLSDRIDGIRAKIMENASSREWIIDAAQLDDRHILRRMILKRCVYGVDKNPMAVELAKVSLWLHTFTVGAPLSFLDHHLRCGDSLFGFWVRPAIDKAERESALFLNEPLNRATQAVSAMQEIEELTDSEIAEAHRSAEIYHEISSLTAPLNAFLSLLHSFDWLISKDSKARNAQHSWLDGRFGDPVEIAQGRISELPETENMAAASASNLLANLNSIPFDFVARQKIQGQHLNWYIVEQLPVVPPKFYEDSRFGLRTAAEIVREAVLELTYTAHDLAPYARDMGHVDANGDVYPPFSWNAVRRLRLRAKLDALFFHLYGVTDRDDVRYIYSTFPIVERVQKIQLGHYGSRDYCLAWMNALAAGKPDAVVDL